MRKPLILPMILAIAFAVSCANKTNVSVPPNLPTGAIDAQDANAFRVIADAWSFISSVRTSVSSGALTLSPTQKAAFNDTVLAYNTAYAVGMAYHNKTNTNVATLNTATSNLSTQLTNASAVITTATK